MAEDGEEPGMEGLFAGIEDEEEESEEVSALRSALWAAEVALLEPGASAASSSPPAALGTELRTECSAIMALLNAARGGDMAALLADPWLAALADALARDKVEAALAEGGTSALCRQVAAARDAFVGTAPPGAEGARELGVMLAAACALQLYMRSNWTGPPLASGTDALPFDPDAAAEDASGGQEFLEALEVDGEPAYELLRGIGYLWLAAVLLGTLPIEGLRVPTRQTRAIWSGRCAFAWQLSLADASERGLGQSPWLFKLSLCDLVGAQDSAGSLSSVFCEEVLSSVRGITQPALQAYKPAFDQGPLPAAAGGALPSLPAEVHSTLLVEFTYRMCWYGRWKFFDDMLRDACGAMGFSFEVTGVFGIKRKYQQEEFAQLVVKATNESQPAASSGEEAAGRSEGATATAAPNALTLFGVDDLTDVLERPKLSSSLAEEDRSAVDRPLTAVEQLLVLSRCHYLWATSNPNDEMLLQEINALAQRVLTIPEQAAETADEADGPMLTANWLAFSCGLYFRCRAEHHRNKTRERASFQLQSLVDQFNDERPSAAHRILLAHSAGYPARFHLQREMGMRMMRMGMVSTAHEQFKSLRMWPEAVDCLMVAERNVEALDMVRDLLEKSPTPRLWCCLGDLEKDPGHYEKAWEVSKRRHARAMRSLGRHWFQKGELAKAIECFEAAVGINPLHSNIWFTMGCAQMKLERYEDCVPTFSRCIGVADDYAEAWANLAAAHSARGKLREARQCMSEAARRAKNAWRMWESFLGICMQLRDVQGCIQAMRRLVDLEQANRISERVLGLLTSVVVGDVDGLYDARTGKAFSNMLMDFFRHLTSRISSQPCYWRFYAELQESAGQHSLAVDSRLKQVRSAQAKLWEERDPDRFTAQLQDFTECLELLEKGLAEPCSPDLTQHLQPFAFLTREVRQRLAAKREAGDWRSEWAPALEAAASLAARCEARGSIPEGAAEDEA